MFEKIKNILRWSIPYKIYKSTESEFAKIYFRNPSKDMIVIWVTWTDGKSTTSNLIHKILNDNLWKTALFTTVNNKFWDEEHPNTYKMTNISAWQTQEFLRTASEKWCKYCVLEVSSHGISQKRVANIEYDVAVLTNISEEHLDYHKTLLDYANTKKELFQWVLRNQKGLWIAVINKDDNIWKQWLEEMAFKKSISFWINSSWEIRANDIKQYIDHTEFKLKYLSKEFQVKTHLLWKFNVYNILAAISVWQWLKISFENLIKSIEEFKQVNWRMNYFTDERWVNYFIDYAHTPAALKAVLEFLNSLKEWNKIITVFWAPWVRDKGKRPKMWYIVDQLSDVIILTDDDPDKEPRQEILDQVAKWIKRKLWDDFWIMPERELAIELAYWIAKKWDIVLIAGKWHETVQLTNNWKRHYSDIETLKNIINNDKKKPI